MMYRCLCKPIDCFILVGVFLHLQLVLSITFAINSSHVVNKEYRCKSTLCLMALNRALFAEVLDSWIID